MGEGQGAGSAPKLKLPPPQKKNISLVPALCQMFITAADEAQHAAPVRPRS